MVPKRGLKEFIIKKVFQIKQMYQHYNSNGLGAIVTDHATNISEMLTKKSTLAPKHLCETEPSLSTYKNEPM